MGRVDIYKPRGLSSHDVVNQVRRVFNERHVGHSGTLDPIAEGVLNVYIGRPSTKFIDILKSDRKTYAATMKFGLQSDTLDLWGNVIVMPRQPFTQEEFEQTLKSFLGAQVQTPPMYSALKKDGKPMYKYAREGKRFNLPTRDIVIHSIELIQFDEEVQFRVTCSKGTYIRSLISDIATKLNNCAVMTGLIREENDFITIEQCVALEELTPNDEKNVDESVPLFRQEISEDIHLKLLQGKPSEIPSKSKDERIILTMQNQFVGTAILKEDGYVRERMFI